MDFWPSSNGMQVAGSNFVGTAAPFGMRAVDPATSLSGWQYHTRAPVRQLLSQGRGALAKVICVTEDGLLASLPPWRATGKAPKSENWFARLRGARIEADVTLAENRLLIPADDLFVYCLDAGSGTVQWKYGVGQQVDSPVFVHEGIAYACLGGELHAIDMETGRGNWTSPDAARCLSALGDSLYVVNSEGMVSVRQLENGTEVSTFECPSHGNLPMVLGGGLFLCSDGVGNLVAMK
jgi:outer membrane protein assembly factor BamB